MKKQLDRFYKRLVAEGILKSFLTGLGLGAAVIVLTAFFSWMFAYDGGLWLAIGLGAGALVISAVLFYFLKYRPVEVDVARRVDELGLEERLITMMELEGDDSYIAQRQREDAREQAALACNSGKKIKISISAALIAVAVLGVVAGASMATVTGLAAADIVPYGIELIDPSIEEAKYVTVTYSSTEGGTVEGELSQKFLKGGDGSEVYVVADDGYMFTGWSDGSGELYRTETGVEENLTLVANFTEVSGITVDDELSFSASSAPYLPSESTDGEMDYSDLTERTDEDQPDSTRDAEYGEKAENNVIDGETSLNDVKQQASDSINESLSGDNDYDSDETDLLGFYSGTILNP